MRRDDGTALLEFTWLAVLLMVPLVWVMLSVFAVQRAAFGVTEAARQAGRAYVRAPDEQTGLARARVASDLALHDQGIAGAPPPQILAPAGLVPGARVTAVVEWTVTLPVVGVLPGHPGVPVRARHTEVVDAYRAAR